MKHSSEGLGATLLAYIIMTLFFAGMLYVVCYTVGEDSRLDGHRDYTNVTEWTGKSGPQQSSK